MAKPSTGEQRDRVFQLICDEVADMTAKDIVRTYIWPDGDDAIDDLVEEYEEQEKD